MTDMNVPLDDIKITTFKLKMFLKPCPENKNAKRFVFLRYEIV